MSQETQKFAPLKLHSKYSTAFISQYWKKKKKADFLLIKTEHFFIRNENKSFVTGSFDVT